MGSRVTFAIGGQEFQVYAPQYGYTSKIALPFHFQRKLPRGYAVTDDGTDYDVRSCNLSFMLDATEAERLVSVYRDEDKGRGVQVGMRLHKNSGFTPFGPDKGDYGNYAVTIYDLAPSGALRAPWKYFSLQCSMIGTEFPDATEPAERTDGTFQIGAVTGLRFPSDFPKPDQNYAVDVTFTRNGTADAIDRLASSDHYETSLKMICSRSRAYALVKHLVETVRTNNVNIVAGNGTYLFGVENGAGGTYTCQWIDTELTVAHIGFNRYEIPLKFSLVSVA